MITRLNVSNYRSLGPKVTLSLGRLNVLVGQNGSGKSNVVDVIRFVTDCLHIGLEGAITRRHGIGAVRRWTSGHPTNVAIELHVEGDGFTGRYGFELAGDKVEEYTVKREFAEVMAREARHAYAIEHQAWVEGPRDLRPNITRTSLALPLIAGDDRFSPLGNALKQSAVYTIFPDTLREPQKYDPTRPMRQHGENWVSILRDQDADGWRDELVSALSELTGEIDAVEVKPLGGYLLARFRHGVRGRSRRPKWFNSAQESDGTLRIAGIITALSQEPPPAVIGIEEPELTIHPGAIPLVYDFIHQASRRTQIILTTHSPEVLDRVDVDRDTVLVVSKPSEDGITRVSAMAMAQQQAVRQNLMTLGEVFRSEGIQPSLPFDGADDAGA